MEEKDHLLEIATVIYPQCIEIAQKTLFVGQSCEEKPQAIAAKMAIAYAMELMYQREQFKLDNGF